MIDKSIIINLEDSIYFLLQDNYIKEFEVIDGLSQHPDGLNFKEWLKSKNIRFIEKK